MRAERSLSRQSVAEAIGVNYQTIGYIERGDYFPSLDLAFRLSEVFGVPIEMIFSRQPFQPLSTALHNQQARVNGNNTLGVTPARKKPMKEVRFLGMSLSPRDNRRRVVAAMYGMFGASLAMAVIGRIQDSPWLGYFAAFPLLAGFLCYWPVYQFTRRFAIRADGTPGRTDEREMRVLEAAMMKAYHYVCGAVVLGLLWMLFASDGLQVWTPQTGAAWNMVLISFLITSQSVPQAIISWSEPDAETVEATGSMNLRSAS